MENINFEATKSLSKWQFKKIVKEYITDLNVKELLTDSKKYKKVNSEKLSNEEFKKKDYISELNLAQVRDRFRLEAQMYGDLKGSFPSKFRRRGVSLKCEMQKTSITSLTFAPR